MVRNRQAGRDRAARSFAASARIRNIPPIAAEDQTPSSRNPRIGIASSGKGRENVKRAVEDACSVTPGTRVHAVLFLSNLSPYALAQSDVAQCNPLVDLRNGRGLVVGVRARKGGEVVGRWLPVVKLRSWLGHWHDLRHTAHRPDAESDAKNPNSSSEKCSIRNILYVSSTSPARPSCHPLLDFEKVPPSWRQFGPQAAEINLRIGQRGTDGPGARFVSSSEAR